MMKKVSMAVVALAILALSSNLALAGTVVFEDDFENGSGNWEPTDKTAWTIKKADDGSFFSLTKDSDYKPPHTSPYNIAWIKGVELGDFQATLKVRSTTHNYGHRDVCFFLGRQDAGHFYYCHLSKEMDDRANQIFIVNGTARTKISEKTTEGVPWDDQWHTIRIVRKLEDGLIQVYFDDMETPIMEAHDTTFGRGQFGVGSFDDRADFLNVKIESLEETASSDSAPRRRLFRRVRNR